MDKHKHNCSHSECCILRELIPGEFDGKIKPNTILVPKVFFNHFKEYLQVELLAMSAEAKLSWFSKKYAVTLEFYNK